MIDVYSEIKKDKQIWKFCFYGLLKNLKFFEPYLIVYMLNMGMNLFKIGVLFSIREIITYIFEVPSGIFADNYGKKKELMMCFAFYMISFVFLFLGINFYIMIIGMIFFGLGEAFRSGTHKAMIYSYLERKGWFKHKTFVYGRTRSFSLIGSSISAFMSILLIFNLPGVRWIFLICIIPYALDFILIYSYPDYLDERRNDSLSVKTFFIDSVTQLRNIFTHKTLSKVLISSSLYDGIFKTVKDYIQPILKATIIGVAISGLCTLSQESKVELYLGITYGIFYIVSSIASRNVYKLNKFAKSDKLMSLFFDIMGILAISMFIAIKNSYTIFVIIIFFILYVLKDARRPLFVDVCGDYMEKTQRTTVMSVDSQLRSLFMIVFSPLFGYIADNYSIEILFLLIGIFSLFINRLLKFSNMQIKEVNN